MRSEQTAVEPFNRQGSSLCDDDNGPVTVSIKDVLIPKHMVGLWIEMVVHATGTLHKITGNHNITVDEEAVIERDGSVTFRIRMPANHGEVAMNVPMGMWSLRKIN